jgi:hypothetical protein
MRNIPDALILRDNAKAELMQIKTIEEGITYLNKVKSIEVWVKAEKKDAELQNIIAEQKIRTQRILGQLLHDSEKGQGMRTDLVPLGHEVKKKETLSDIGLSRKQSHAFQQIATIPEDEFEEFIAEKKEAVNNAVAELTTSGALRLAQSIKENHNTKNNQNDSHAASSEFDAEADELLARINQLPVFYRIKIKKGIRLGK